MLSTAFAWLASRSKGKVAVFFWSALSVLVLCILGGLRKPFVQTDINIYAWWDYREARNALSYAKFVISRKYYEPGYLLVCYISAQIFGNLNWNLFSYQLVTISCFYIGAYRQRKNISLPLLILAFCFLYYNLSYNVMRQSMACGIVFMGISHLSERKYFRFSLYVLAAFFFHRSALVVFPLLIALHIVMTSQLVLNNSWLKLFIIGSTFVILIFARSLMSFILSNFLTLDKYSGYMSRLSRNITSWSAIVIPSAELLALSIYSKQAKKVIVPVDGGGVNFFQFSLFFSIMYGVMVRLLTDRIFMYSNYMNLILIASFPKFIKEKYLKVIIIMVIIFSLVLQWWNYYINHGMHSTWPYQSIL